MGGSTTSKTNQWQFSSGTSNTEPWAVQTPYLKNAFTRAEDAYNKSMAEGPYKGDFVALGDQKNADAFNQAFQFGTDPTNNAHVQNLLNRSNDWVNDGSLWMRQGAEGLRNLSGDQTQTLINQAGQYADNPYISAAVRSAMHDANRQASEATLPNMYRAAAASNTLNSDRAALTQGVVERGLAEQAGNISADMRYKAWDKGLSTAESELNARRSGYGTLAGLGQGVAGMGAQGISTGIENQSRLNQMSAAGAEGLRMLRQAGLDNDMAKYETKANFPWQALNNYYNIIGNKSWGGKTDWSQQSYGQSETEQRTNPGIGSIAGGLLGSLGGMFSGGQNSAAHGISSAASGLFGFLSEDSEKVDVQPVGTLPNGIPLYAYRYKGDPKHYPKVVGPMASEVEKLMPDAVTRINGGPRIVDYDKVFA